MNRFEGRTAVVTGASSGNGRAIALRLASEGAAVACLDLTPEARPGGFEESPEVPTHDLIRQRGGRAIFAVADVTDPAALDAAADATVAEFGRLDVWVNNAGVAFGKAGILDASDDQFRVALEVNVQGTWNGARAAFARMREQEPSDRLRGAIVNIGSVAGSVGQSGLGAYSASKGAVHNLTRALAMEFAPDLVSVNAVAPGYLPTAMNRGAWEDEERLRHIRELHPLPLGVPADIAAAVAYLGSSDAAFVTGVVLPVDGGFTAR